MNQFFIWSRILVLQFEYNKWHETMVAEQQQRPQPKAMKNHSELIQALMF